MWNYGNFGSYALEMIEFGMDLMKKPLSIGKCAKYPVWTLWKRAQMSSKDYQKLQKSQKEDKRVHKILTPG